MNIKVEKDSKLVSLSVYDHSKEDNGRPTRLLTVNTLSRVYVRTVPPGYCHLRMRMNQYTQDTWMLSPGYTYTCAWDI